MGLNPLSLTWARVNAARHGPTPTRLNMVLDWLGSIWAQADSTCARTDLARSGSESTRLPGLGQLGSTWTRANYTRPEPELTRLDIGPGHAQANLALLGSRQTQLNLDPSRLDLLPNWLSSTWTCTHSTRHWPKPTPLNMFHSARHGPRPAGLDSRWAQVDSTWACAN